MPGPARPVAPYMRFEKASANRGQKRGVVRVDGRTVHGRLLKNTRAALLEHLGPGVTIPQKAIIERIAWLELRCALFDQKQIDGTFTQYDADQHLALINALRRLYGSLGTGRPGPKFASLLKKRPQPEAAD